MDVAKLLESLSEAFRSTAGVTAVYGEPRTVGDKLSRAGGGHGRS